MSKLQFHNGMRFGALRLLVVLPGLICLGFFSYRHRLDSPVLCIHHVCRALYTVYAMSVGLCIRHICRALYSVYAMSVGPCTLYILYRPPTVCLVHSQCLFLETRRTFDALKHEHSQCDIQYLET